MSNTMPNGSNEFMRQSPEQLLSGMSLRVQKARIIAEASIAAEISKHPEAAPSQPAPVATYDRVASFGREASYAAQQQEYAANSRQNVTAHAVSGSQMLESAGPDYNVLNQQQSVTAAQPELHPDVQGALSERYGIN